MMSAITIHSRAFRLAYLTTARRSLSPTVEFIRRRSMATASRREFLCILLDRPDVLKIRKKVKGIHYEGVKPLVASGRLVVGGAMFDKHPVDGEPAPFKGSMIVYSAGSAEEVRDIINQDVYATSGVWDLEKVQIIPTTLVVYVGGARTHDMSPIDTGKKPIELESLGITKM